MLMTNRNEWQQYLYRRQMDWARWAALDEAKRERDAFAVSGTASMPRPVTPPMEDVPTPTTPVRQLVTSTASVTEVEAMLPPGQPRKTPTGKRVALEMLCDEDEVGDGSNNSMEDIKMKSECQSRGAAPVTKQSRTISPSGKTVMKTATAVAGSPAKQPRTVMPRGPLATASKPVRASPRIQGLANARRAGGDSVSQAVGVQTAPSHSTQRTREEQVTMTRSRSGTQPQQSQRTSRPPSKIPSRKISRAPSPPALSSSGKITPSIVASGAPLSRLPTLIPSKRAFAGKSLSMTTAVPAMKSLGLATVSEGDPANINGGSNAPGQDQVSEDAWMSGADAMAVVEPGTKPGSRPSIQRVRRRRSSFSSVDINM